jgi:hypothetical protein
MEEYLSNATGELGYTLLEVDRLDLLEKLDDSLLERALDDLAADVRRAYEPTRSLDPQRCVGILRKLFGSVVLIALTFRGEKLAPFATELANRTVVPLGDQVRGGARPPDDIVPITLLDSVLRLAFLIAQAEFDYEENGDISRETTGDILKLVCNADPWAQNVMRLTDWLSVYLTRRWDFRGAEPERVREFVRNFDAGAHDHLELAR